jgi:dipeptidyl aminopeptidase/acylaminoacyl peptidase
MMAGHTLGDVDHAGYRMGPGEPTEALTPATRAHSHHIEPEDITMLGTLPTPTFSHLASAVRRLLLPALVLTSAACDNPTEPIRSQPRPTFAVTAPIDAKGQILFTSGATEAKLFLADPVTTNVVQLPSGPGPYSVGSWSADFTKITFSKGLWGGLWTMDADGSNETQVLAMPLVRTSVFSPDGQYIAFIANVPDAQVHTVEIATGVVKQLTNLPGIHLRVSWSVDGKKLLFGKEDSGIGNLFTIAPDGTGLTQVTKCVKVYCNDGQFSPDGTRIAFIYGGRVATMAATGGNVKMVTGPKEPQPHYPSWSPDGKQLAYERYAGPYHHDIWVVDLVTGAKTPVVTSRVDDTTPSWSR